MKEKTNRQRGKNKRGGSGIAVCLVYPNRREVGLANLGFHKIYASINAHHSAWCDIAFLPDGGGRPISEETGRPLERFDLVAFSITFEMDYLNALKILHGAKTGLDSEKRGDNHPIVCAGGVAVTLNPEPVSRIFDFFVIGEGEVSLNKLLDSLAQNKESAKQETLKRLTKIPGIYVPSLYDEEYGAHGEITSKTPRSGAPEKVARLYNPSYENIGGKEEIPSANHIFKDSSLIETGKGCGQGCRFCAAGFVYRPVRHVKTSKIYKQVDAGLEKNGRIGLIGSAICEHPDMEDLFEYILKRGGKMNVSSLRIGKISKSALKKLERGGCKTVTLAPEAGTERLRNVINKQIGDKEIVDTVRESAEVGILNVKLYFLIGLPFETAEDIKGIVRLVKAIRDAFVKASKPHGRVGRISVGINPFVPKAQTPFQWERFAPQAELKRKIKSLRSGLAGQSNVTLKIESVRQAAVQALLSTGSRETGQMILDVFNGKSWSAVFRESRDSLLHERVKAKDEILPWDFIESQVERNFLWKEYEKSKNEKTTPECPPPRSGCRRCGEFSGICS